MSNGVTFDMLREFFRALSKLLKYYDSDENNKIRGFHGKISYYWPTLPTEKRLQRGDGIL